MLTTISRLNERILNRLIEKEYSNLKEKKQSGFRVGKSYTDNIFYLKQIIEKKTRNQEIHIVFIDFRKL